MRDPVASCKGTPERAQEIAELLRNAFGGITLGEGTGLREGDGLDDHRTVDQLDKLREEDEKLNWQNIPFDDLQRYTSAWHCLDAQGLLFHTPAFMMNLLVGGGDDMIIIRLCYPSVARDRLFAVLDDEQKLVVRLFLMHYLESGSDLESEGEAIRAALDEFWVSQVTAQTIGEQASSSDGDKPPN